MGDSRQLEVTATVAARPQEVFALLADPARHPDLDGSGTLRRLVSGQVITAVGDEFVMDMHQPALGDYRMRNVVIDFEPNRRIAWAPSPQPAGTLATAHGDPDAGGHTWSWELEPTATGGTRLTQTYDWSGVADARLMALLPVVSEEQMAATVTRIAEATRRPAEIARSR